MSGSAGANLPVHLGVTALPDVEAAFNRVQQIGGQAMTRLSQGSQAAAASTGTFRGAIGQAGYQLQDFVVQIQAGTNWMTALSQQGSQFLGIFGPAGAAAGAALVVGLLAAQFLDLGSATERAEAAEKAYGEAVQRSNTFLLTAIQRTQQLNSARRVEEIGSLGETLETLRAEYRRVVDEIQRLTGANDAPDAQAFSLSQMTAETRRLVQQREARAALLQGRIAEMEGRLGQTAYGASGAERDEAEALDRALSEQRRIRAEHEERVARLRYLASRGVYTQGQLAEREVESLRKRDEALEALARRGQTGTRAGTPEQLAGTLDRLRGQQERDLQQEVDRFVRAVESPLEAYKRRMQEIRSLALRAQTDGNPIPETAIARATDAAMADFERLNNGAENTINLGRELGMTFNSAFEDMIARGKSFREILGGIAQDLARLVIRQTITAPLGNIATKAIGNFDFSSIFSSIFGGQRAAGGPVSPGMIYEVGERGRELFMPDRPGTIMPTGSYGGATFAPVYNIDARGADPSMLPRLEARMVAIAQASLAQFQQQINRGGGAAKLVGRR